MILRIIGKLAEKIGVVVFPGGTANIGELHINGKVFNRERRNRKALLYKIRESWIEGFLEKSFASKARIELSLEQRLDAVSLDYDSPEQLRQVLPTGTKLSARFTDQLGVGHTLLIIGAPGSGKTITLLEFTHDLVERAESDISFPIPIFLKISSWTIKRGTIAVWLLQELQMIYKVPKKLAQDWLKEQQFILILDGLDEVKLEFRDQCVAAINQFSQDYGQTDIIVSSRIEDYENLTVQLRFQTAIFIQPLSPQQVENYLDLVDNQLSKIRLAIQIDPVLQELSQTPLMLSIMVLAYQGLEVDKLPKMTLEERREHLWDKYIQRMLERRKYHHKTLKKTNQTHYSPKQVMFWLSWLSRYLHQDSQTVFLIEYMQPKCLQTQKQRLVYRFGVGIFSGLVSGLIFGIAVILITVLDFGVFKINSSNIYIDLFYGLSSILACILIVLLISLGSGLGDIKDIKPVENLRWSWLRFTKTLFACLSLLLIVGIVGPFFDLFNGFSNSLGKLPEIYWLSILITGLFLGLIRWLTKRHKHNILEELFFDLFSGGVISTYIAILWIIFSALLWIFAYVRIWLTHCQPNQLNFCLSVALSHYFSSIVSFGLIGLIIGLISGVIYGLISPDINKTKTVPNQGIWQALSNAKSLFLVGGGIIFGILFLYGSITRLQSHSKFLTFRDDLEGALLGGIIAGIFCGLIAGVACIQHTVLRIILHQKGYIPWNYADFLDWASDHLFLRKVGGGYVFIHRLLMEHFLKLKSEKYG